MIEDRAADQSSGHKQMDATSCVQPTPRENPCITCGACCAFYRASFYWAETEAGGGTVPVAMTEKLNDFRAVMIGSNPPNVRCCALVGTIGQSVGCSIYDLRASVCRDFKVSWEDGVHNPRCDAARAAWGLEPLPKPDRAADDPTNPDKNEPPCRPPLPRAA